MHAIKRKLFDDLIARKFIARSILISTVFSILASGVQIYSRYQDDLKTLNLQFEYVEKGYTASIEKSIWLFSFEQLEAILDGIIQQQDVAYLEIKTNTGQIFSRGEPNNTAGALFKNFPLTYNNKGQPVVIGSLSVYLTKQAIFKQLRQDVWFIIISNFVKTVLVSLSLFALFYSLVGRHLQKISQHIASPTKIEELEHINLTSKKIANDHLDQICHSYNAMLDRTKESHSQLNNVINELVKKNEQLETFAYISSHDLKEPVRTILSFCALLERELDGQLSDESLKYMDFISNACQQINALLKALLSYTQIDHITDYHEVVNMKAITKAVVSNAQTLIGPDNVIINIGDLPVITGNKILLSLVMQNLLTNAIKYQVPNKQSVIDITATKQDQHWIFSVADNGIGIEKAYHQQIFEPFKRLHNQEQYKGSGIGLTICKKIIDSCGGEIWVESSGIEGANFKFSLPIKVEKK